MARYPTTSEVPSPLRDAVWMKHTPARAYALDVEVSLVFANDLSPIHTSLQKLGLAVLQLTEGEVGLNFLDSKIKCGFVVEVRAKGNFVGFLKKQAAIINALGSQRSRLFAEVKRLYVHLGCLRQGGHCS